MLEDLAAAAPPAASSSSDGDSDCEQETAAAVAPASAQPSGQHGSACSKDAAAAGVHISQDTCSSSGWRRVLVQLEGQQGTVSDRGSSSSADDKRAQQVAVAADQMAAIIRSAGAAAGVCSLRCWYAVDSRDAGSQSNAAWQAVLVSRLREGIGQQEMALQAVQVCTVATSTQPGPCWAVVEAFVAP